MYIESIELKNFRNYQDLQLGLDKGTNIFYGDNAQGKTNILESVYICGTTKSHKGSKDKEIIRFGEDESHIRMMLKKDGISYKIDMHLRKNKAKGVAINGLPIKKARELFGIVNLVFFSPEDLNIIKNGPGERRRFIDLELCQLDNIYLTDLSGYNHILNQRNRLLKDLYMNPSLKETLDIWDLQMVQYGKKIIDKRSEFIRDLNEVIQGIHRNLTGGEEHIEVLYEPSSDADCFEETLKHNRERDIKMKMTSAGPHRDDLSFVVNGIDIRKYGSQGQQRTAALSLKLSEIYLVKQKIKDTPVLLLDDVLSELDSNRQTYLLDSIHDIQTLITCTGLDDFVSHQFHINKVFRVVRGEVFNPVN
ncbi:DNA replication/repair protein RecF [Blautia sp. MSJ-19]|uniref:DNA replication/repair protein RecF n=1 Tax=Blautia sp. MSJ-19 TaxID=2841517 RepID=UPI001C0E9C0A|nr:DNA replication/repair protein RecF [Blautia sp. MSJ-19]MBU5482165.1 DNA replication/repair protein RecF [Blautia sp. MSJ-19]